MLLILRKIYFFTGYYNRYIINANHHDNSEPSTIDVSSIKDATNVDHATEHPVQDGTGRSTYRCYSTSLSDTTLFSEPFTVRSIVDQSSARTAKVERRCKIDSVSNADQNEPTKRDKFVLCVTLHDFYIKLL